MYGSAEEIRTRLRWPKGVLFLAHPLPSFLEGNDGRSHQLARRDESPQRRLTVEDDGDGEDEDEDVGVRMRDDSAVSGGGDVVDVSLRSNSTTIDSLSRVCHTRLLACD